MMNSEQTARIIIEINDKKAEEKIEKLEKKASALRKLMQKAVDLGDEKSLENIGKELKKVNNQLSQVRTRAEKVRAAMRNLDAATPKQLRETIKAITAELNSGKIARGSKEWDAYVAKLKVAKAELAKVNAEMAVTQSKSSRLIETFNKWGAAAAAGAAAFAGVVMSGKKAVETYAEMQQEEANVRKFTGMTAEEVAKLNEEFKKMDTRTSRQELNKLAQEAGRLGKTSHDDVLGFVRAADKINVALDDLGDGATLTLSKLTGIFGDEKRYGTEKALLKVGSVINELSQNCSASAPYLAEFASRMGGVGAQAGLTIQQIMGFGAVLDENNQKVEASSTALSQVLVRIYQDPAKYAKVAGLEVQKFTNLVKKDANEALILFLTTLNKAGGMDTLSPMFKDMGETGSRAISALATLANNIDKVKWQQNEANKAFHEGISVINEFDVQNTTAQAGLEKARKGFTEVAVALGEELLPAMRYCISGTSMLMRTMLTAIKFFKEHKGIIIALTTAVVAYTATIKAKTIQENIATGATKALTLAQKAWSAAIKANPLGLLVAALAAAIAYLGTYRDKLKEVSKGEKELNEVRAAASVEVEKEKNKIEKLISVAMDETVAMDKRKKAVEELNRIIPDYNAQIDETTRAFTASTEALDKYLIRLKKKAEIQGAWGLLEDLGSQKAKLVSQRAELEKAIKDTQDLVDRGISERSSGREGILDPAVAKNTTFQLQVLQSALAGIDVQLGNIADKEKTIESAYGEDLYLSSIKTGTEADEKTSQAQPQLSDKELKKLEAERKKKLKEEAREAKAEMVQILADIAVRREMALAENTAAYAAGLKDYRQFIGDEHEIRLKSVRDEGQVYAQRGMVATKEYAKVIKTEQDLLYKWSQKKLSLKLEEIEKEKKQRVDFLTLAYSSPKSSMYGNEKVFRQKLLQYDIDYLEKKKQLYASGSKEAADIEMQIQQKLADDKLQKQKELAKAYETFAQQYLKASGSKREKMELESMKALLDEKLITQEQYERAVNDIKEKYAKKDRDRLRKTESEYADMVVNIRDSFRKLFEDIKDGGIVNLGKVAEATQSAFAVMSAVVQSYSSYVNAQRDEELAKVEARYEKEIAAAGNNSKKREKLEKQKEAEIAKIKNKYAKKQQNMEIAMAIANTAQAAIAAYASAVKVSFILGPIAAAMATAFGMLQVATIKKQYKSDAGYYTGGYTPRDPNNRKEVGVVHANEFVANHEAVNNAALSPVLRLIDYAQRNNRVASLTRTDVSNAIGQGSGVSARGAVVAPSVVVQQAAAPTQTGSADVLERVGDSINRLNRAIDSGIETYVIMDGERGLAKRLDNFNKLKRNPKR